MGQKVNPHGLRVGIIKDWDSRWYAKNELVGDLLVEDHKIREYLKRRSTPPVFPRSRSSATAPRCVFTFTVPSPAWSLARGARRSSVSAPRWRR